MLLRTFEEKALLVRGQLLYSKSVSSEYWKTRANIFDDPTTSKAYEVKHDLKCKIVDNFLWVTLKNKAIYMQTKD